MKVAFFSTKPYDEKYFSKHAYPHQFTFYTEALSKETALLAKGHEAVCAFVNDNIDQEVLEKLSNYHIQLIIVRAASADNIDFNIATRLDINVEWVPGYSPEAIAEHTAALILNLNRKIHLAYQRTHKGNFKIDDLIGFNLSGKTIGIIGLGRIGLAFAKIMRGFGCKVIANDLHKNELFIREDIPYVSFPDLLMQSDIISLHCPLNKFNQHLINQSSIDMMKKGVILINAARGGLVDTQAVLRSLDGDKIAAFGLDVYEKERESFNKDFKDVEDINDPILKQLLNHPDVLLTPHQAFCTHEAMEQIAKTVTHRLSFYEAIFTAY